MNGYLPWYLGNSNGFPWAWGITPFIFLLVWSSAWKGLALWHAARREEKWWFIALLFVNTVGILEITYLAFVAKIFGKPGKYPRKKSS